MTVTITSPEVRGAIPLAGPMVRPFPGPGAAVSAAIEQLQYLATDPPSDVEMLRELARLPRPWDPGTCTGELRAQLWTWLEEVAIWINEQHLWNVTRPGIPECWPAHPHLVHDLAALACSRHYARFAVTPTALEEWHQYNLPSFLERLRDRLGDGCQPGRHLPRPRTERDHAHAAETQRAARAQHYKSDLDHANTTAAAEHERW